MKTRADQAEAAISNYPGDTDHAITAVLVDLLHLAAREGLDIDRAIFAAKVRYSDDRR